MLFRLRSKMMLLALLAMMRCLPIRRRRASSAKRHHVRRTHHLPDRANIMEKTSSFDEAQTADKLKSAVIFFAKTVEKSSEIWYNGSIKNEEKS